jgi:hypothetical protein
MANEWRGVRGEGGIVLMSLNDFNDHPLYD